MAGLLTLREGQPFSIYATEAVLTGLEGNPMFRVLDLALVQRVPMALDQPVETTAGIEVTAFAVPGKVPLYDEGDEVRIGRESDTTVGLRVAGAGTHFFYIPGCVSVSPALLAARERRGPPLL